MATAIWKDATAPASPSAAQVQGTGLINAPSTYSAVTGTAADATAAKYNATTGNAANWGVDENQTVSGQLDKILKSDSPLMKSAETYSKQAANQRGLINSSMAVGAGQKAVIDSALPIAQHDATTYANSNQFNAGNQQQMNLANMQATNTADQFNAGNQQQVSLTNTAADNAMTSQNLQSQNQAGQFNAASANEMKSQLNQLNTQMGITNATETNKLAMQNLDNQFKVSIANADAANKAYLQQMADTTKASLASIEAQYKQAISGSEAAERMFSKATQNITDIINNPDITDATARNAYIQNQINYLKSGMGLMEAVSGLELDSLLTF